VPAFDRVAQSFPALNFDRVEPNLESVVMQRRPGTATIGTAWWCGIGGRPHPHTWTLAAELRPSSRRGLTAVAMRPQAQSPVCGWGLQTPRHRSSFISPHQSLPMPVCRNCLHRGEDHNWTAPECSVCARRDPDCRNCARNLELRRMHGACLSSGSKRRCICSKYVPLADELRRPVNAFVGRALYRRRR
jgi:hypothetical protein